MDLPADLKQFLIEQIDSVADLEALLLVRRESGEPWTPERLAGRLYVDRATAIAILDGLERRGFLVAGDAGYAYDPRDESLRAAAGRLAELHATHLIPMTRVIHSKPSANIRRFADAFRFREKK